MYWLYMYFMAKHINFRSLAMKTHADVSHIYEGLLFGKQTHNFLFKWTNYTGCSFTLALEY